MHRISPGRRPLAVILALFLLSGTLAGCGAKKATADPEPAPVTEAPAPAPEVPPAPVAPPEPEKPPRPDPELPGAIAVMVENSFQARPQAGLDRASLVYELEAEYGISRFMAFFYDLKAERIGPVRSARLGFYDIAAAYGVPYGHAGGSEEALAILRQRNSPLLDLDEIYTCGHCFWRSKEREAPHNLYTSTALITGRAKDVGFAVMPLHRFTEGEMPGGQPVSQIAFSWGPETQRVSWSWNGRRYERSQSGSPHVMEDGSLIQADNLVLIFTRYVWDPKAQPWSGLHRITVVGSGAGYLYRGGQAWPIAWSKSAREEHFSLSTPDGSPVQLAPGQTWVEVLKAKEHITAGNPE